jgi:hypothetical protein
MEDTERRVRCFMDGMDWQHELGFTDVLLHPTQEALEKNAGHDLTACGVVEVEVRFIRWIKEPMDEE